MSIVNKKRRVHTNLKSLTTNNGMTIENMPPQDSVQTALSYLTMKPVTSHDEHMLMKFPATKCSFVNNIEDKSKSNKVKYEDNDCYIIIPQSKSSTSMDDYYQLII